MDATTAAIDGLRLSEPFVSMIYHNTTQTSCWWMSHIRANEDYGLLEDLGAHVRHQNVVDSTEFDVDFEAKVG